MKRTIQLLFAIVLLNLALSTGAYGQGDNYIFFSNTGDTLITRTSCSGAHDTLKSYFNILKNVNGDLELISVFFILEPGKNSIPCADFKLVSRDTLQKYGLNKPGILGVTPRKLNIQSKVLKGDTVRNDKGELVYQRTIRHEFRIRRKVFYTSHVLDVTQTLDGPILQPRITEIFGNKKLKKYCIEFNSVSNYIDKDTGKTKGLHDHLHIVN